MNGNMMIQSMRVASQWHLLGYARSVIPYYRKKHRYLALRELRLRGIWLS